MNKKEIAILAKKTLQIGPYVHTNGTPCIYVTTVFIQTPSKDFSHFYHTIFKRSNNAFITLQSNI